ncbi:MAG: hypothetical protein A2049_04760 [Elusimicrobia bacterium GWA2_62_23]|nr:MAG: hypothetical protein A2049_04760 [Elusimicrobia bacterium GWA2_62_23]
MAEAQAELGHEVSIAATGDMPVNSRPGGRVKVLLFPRTLPFWMFSWSLGRNLQQLIAASDLVHIHMMWEYPAWKASQICAALGKPYIIRPCGMLDKWSLAQSAWKKKVYLELFGNRLLSCSAAVHYTSAGEMAASLPENKRPADFVLPVGLPVSAWEGLPPANVFREKFPETVGRRIVLFFGRLHYKKQPEVAIRAFQLLRSRCPEAHLVLVGAGAAGYVASLKLLAKELGLQAHVTFTGMLLGEDKREALSAADIFILPSLRENFGVSVTEAMAAGCPVVVSPGVDISEDIRQGKAGVVCSPDPEAFSAAMAKILNTPGLARSMGENGLRLVQRKYRWDNLARDLIGVYGGVLSGKRYN